MLYIVATPIGNLEDITLRALRTLKEVDYVAAEDTRHSKILLNHHQIDTPLLSYHSHSSDTKAQKIVDLLLEGKNVALISDAGTPGISDPAYRLVNLAIENNIQIVPIPGPSALLAALNISGLPMDKFLYIGFPPLKKGRQTLFQSLAEEPRTIVLFESPHRLLKTLNQLNEFLPDRQIAVCRELTKIHEEALRTSVPEAIEHFTKTKPKGEIVIVISAKERGSH